VLIFDSAGRRLGAIGKQGDGPGEFRTIMSLGWIGDTLWIVDNRATITLAARQGTLIRTRSFERNVNANRENRGAPAIGALLPVALLPNEVVLGRGWQRNEAAERNLLVRATLSGALQRVVAELPLAPPGVLAAVRGTRQFLLTLSEIPGRLYDVAPDGSSISVETRIPSATHAELQFVRIGYGGDTVTNKSIPMPTTPVNRAEVSSTIDRRLASSNHPRDVADQLRATALQALPLGLPPVSAVILGADGATWLEQRSDATSRSWLLFDEQLQERGRISLPQNVHVVEGDARNIWAILVDSDGLESVVRYSVVASPR
jgi:hypothetical protein